MLLGQLAGEDDFEAARKLYEVDLNLQDAITYITKKKAEAEALERERIRIAAEEAAKALTPLSYCYVPIELFCPRR